MKNPETSSGQPRSADERQKTAPEGQADKSNWQSRLRRAFLLGLTGFSLAADHEKRMTFPPLDTEATALAVEKENLLLDRVQHNYEQIHEIIWVIRNRLKEIDRLPEVRNGVVLSPVTVDHIAGMKSAGKTNIDLESYVTASIKKAGLESRALLDYYVAIDPGPGLEVMSPELRTRFRDVPKRAIPKVPQYYAQLNFIEQRVLLTYYNHLEGFVIVDKDPINVTDTVIDEVIERVVRFQESLNASSSNASFERVNVNMPEGEVGVMKKELRDFLVTSINQSFSPAEVAILDSLTRSGQLFELSFYEGPEQNSVKRSLILRPDELARLGKMKFRYLGHIEIRDQFVRSDVFSLYPDIFSAYERSGTLDPTIRLKLGDRTFSIGEINVGDFQYSTDGPYHFYEMNARGNGRFLSDDHWQQVKNQISLMEGHFGVQPGQLVRRVLVDILARGSGGTYRPHQDTLAFFIDKDKKDLSYEGFLSTVTRHEFFHLVDDRFDITEYRESDDTSTAWHRYMEFFEKSHRSRLSQLAESSLDKYGNVNPGAGHPWSNQREFFASSMNTLFISEPEKALLEKDRDFLEWYRDLLTHHGDLLKEVGKLNPEATILRLIDARLQLVEKLLQQLK